MTKMQEDLTAVRAGYTDFAAFAKHWVRRAADAPRRAASISPDEIYARAEEGDLYQPGDWSEIRALHSLGLLTQVEYDYMKSLADG